MFVPAKIYAVLHIILFVPYFESVLRDEISDGYLNKNKVAN